MKQGVIFNREEEVVLPGPPLSTLQEMFPTEERPSKRRKTNSRKINVCDAEKGAARLSEYIPISSYGLVITFDGSVGGHTKRNDPPQGPREIPLVPVVLQFEQEEQRAGNLKLLAQHFGVVMDETVNLRPESESYLREAVRVGSVYRPSLKTAPVCCSTATLHRIPGQKCGFLLNVTILWRDSLEIPGRLQAPAAALFSSLVPSGEGADSHLSCTGVCNGTTKRESWNPSEFYNSVHVPERTFDLPSSVGLNSMPSRLFPFQRRSVRWLLEREGIEVSRNGKLVPRQRAQKSERPPSFVEFKDTDYRTCYASHLFLTVTRDISKWNYADQSLRGGILAEEMGLGKTLELLTLIFLHRRPPSVGTNGITPSSTSGVLVESGATLIITPHAILEQWKQEIQTHAPSLRYVHYKGISKTRERDDALIQDLASSDIVLTTYNVLQREIHYAEEPPARYMRHERKFARPKSPLVQISWWRVCIDEAQMIESGVSNAARVARVVPRHNAWAVSGTPLRKDMTDLFGLFLFLKYEPFCYSLERWTRLYEEFKPVLKAIIGKLVLRHNKTLIKDELQLPPQKRVVITVPFTAVEEQNYDQLFQRMCEECGLELTGAPAVEHWDPNAPRTIEKMRSWLSRLRQACLHAEVRGTARKPLGSGGPLRSVSDVLDVMIDQNDVQIRAEERALLLSQIRRGQLMENALDPKGALNIWQDALTRCEPMVKDCRAQLDYELSKHNISKVEDGDDDEDDETEDEDKDEKTSEITKYRQRLRTALEVKHMCTFFIASSYYQIKTNTELTEPESEEFHELEKLEEEMYESAKVIRREMLSEANRRVSRYIDLIRDKFDHKGLTEIPHMSLEVDEGGIESERILDWVEDYCDAMNKQAAQFTEWRNHMSKLVLRSLIDEEDGAELQGDEYESSTKHQDEMYVFMEALRVMFANRHDSITGQTNILIAHEVSRGRDMAKEDEGPSPELYINLMDTCENLRVPPELGSLRDILSELRSLVTSLEGQQIRGSSRARAEFAIVNEILQEVSQMFASQSKASSALEKEVELFREVMNKRLEYYKQLQQISDTVAPYNEESRGKPLDLDLFELKKGAEHRIGTKISTLKSKHRYLIHLRDESGAEESARICIICQGSFEVGVLTVCGHKYCKDCLRLWRNTHRTCPICKCLLKTNDFHQITYKPTDIVAQEEKPAANPESNRSHNNSIYADISAGALQEIKNIDIPGSFGTKIDTLARHIIWLRQHDPGAKSIVFSQYKPFLEILASAFGRFRIGFTSIDSRDGIERFKKEASVECFLLHAKAHSSGLNLVNATHVFLCEPLINTAIELQAIARVHRIGQHRETTVWMHLVSGSIEESIYDISVSRRLAHIAQKQKEKEQRDQVNGHDETNDLDLANLSENVIESANTLELEDATLGKLLAGPATEGERVDDDDLWQCLFGKAKKNGEASEVVQNEVGRLLRADAAEERQDSAPSLNGL